MAVKVANKVTLSIKAISKALIDRTTPRYARESRWGGFSYDEVIYPQARAVFKDLYPLSIYPTNEEFIERFKKDFYKHDPALQKIITQGEHEIVFNQPENKPLDDLIPATGEQANTMTSGLPQIPSIQRDRNTEVPKLFKEAFKNEPEFKLDQSTQPQIPPIQTVRKAEVPKVFQDAFQTEKIKSSPIPNITTNPGIRYKTGFSNTLKNISSPAGTFFQRNVGKYLTAGRIATGAGALIGGLTGAGLTGGSRVGILSGAVGGAALPSWIRSGGATNFLGKVGNGGLNAVSRLTNPASRNRFLGKNPLLKNTSRRVLFIFLGLFIIFGIFAGILGGLGGGSSAPSGNIGVGIPISTPIASGTPVIHPTPPPVESSALRQRIIDQFGVTMDGGFDTDHLKWAWEKLYEVSGTNFPTLVRGSVIIADPASRQVGCPGSSVAVYLSQYPEELFKYAFTHELGHAIKNCPNSASSFLAQYDNAYDAEHGVTFYARNASACTGSDNKSEDYAEMIARYLNPGTGIQLVKGNDLCIAPRPEYVNLQSSFPLHYNVARSVLGNF